MLRLAIPSDPLGLTPAARDPASQLLSSYLYERLYRLDDRFVPQPELAAAEPAVSDDGLTWTVPLREGVLFHDGTELSAGDVVAAFSLATTSRCPWSEDACATATARLASVAAAEDGGSLVFTVSRPTASFATTVLAGVPILPTGALRASLDRFAAGAAAVSREEAAALATRIDAATNDPACLGAEPPDTCDPGTYAGEIEGLLGRAGIAALDRDRFASENGEVDEAAYAAALAERLDLFAAAITARGAESTAAALPLLDLNRQPVGSGRYAFAVAAPGEFVELRSFVRHRDRARRAPAVIATVVPDPATAATALQAGDLEWLPAVPADEVPGLSDAPGVTVAARPEGSYRAIVFNVRAGRPYADPAARAAFLQCIDRPALVDLATAGRGLIATSWTWADSWAGRAAPLRDRDRDPAAARRALAEAGWDPGAGGTLEKDGARLSTELLVRPGRADQLAFATGAAEQLAECGIELRVREAGLSPDALITQLEWPNDFDTLMTTIDLADDPHEDFGLFHSSRATSETNPGDRNIGGFVDAAVDELVVAAGVESDLDVRADLYGRVAERLSAVVPAIPLWYESGWSAISTAVQDADGEPVDPAGARYEWAAPRWRVERP